MVKLKAKLDGEERRIEVSREDNGRVRVLLDGDEVAGDIREVRPGIYSILLDGRSFEVHCTDEEDGAVSVSLYDDEYKVTLEDPRKRFRPKSGGATGGGTLKAPMHGRIVRILVAPGDRVNAGTGLVVMEAMKMENELQAKAASLVETIPVSVGQMVEKGEVLCLLKPIAPTS